MENQPEQDIVDITSAEPAAAGGKLGKKGKAPSKMKLPQISFKTIGGYLLDGFAPFVASAALILAVYVYNGNHASSMQLRNATAVIHNLQTTLAASKSEVVQLKATLANEKVVHDAELAKRDEKTMKIVQSVSKLQTKLKISPTLEDQMHLETLKLSAVPTDTVAPVLVPALAATNGHANTPVKTKHK